MLYSLIQYVTQDLCQFNTPHGVSKFTAMFRGLNVKYREGEKPERPVVYDLSLWLAECSLIVKLSPHTTLQQEHTMHVP